MKRFLQRFVAAVDDSGCWSSENEKRSEDVVGVVCGRVPGVPFKAGSLGELFFLVSS